MRYEAEKGARCVCLATKYSSHFLFEAGSRRGQTRKVAEEVEPDQGEFFSC